MTYPGDDGFRARFAAEMRSKIKSVRYSCDYTPNPHQVTMVSLARKEFAHHGDGPRVLAVHRTGAGKTLTMIKCLDEYVDDERTKIVIVPNTDLREGFLRELVKHGGPLWNALTKADKKVQALQAKWPRATHDIKSTEAERKVIKTGLKSHLKLHIVTYATNEGVPWTWRGNRQTLDDTIVIMDEAHNLVSPSKAYGKVGKNDHGKNLAQFRERIRQARGSVILAFTATPAGRDMTIVAPDVLPKSMVQLLDIIKGAGKELSLNTIDSSGNNPYISLNDGGTNLQGYMSFFYTMPRGTDTTPVFAVVHADGVPIDSDVTLPNVIEVALRPKGVGPSAFMNARPRKPRNASETTSEKTKQQNRIRNLGPAHCNTELGRGAKAPKLERVASDVAAHLLRNEKVMVLLPNKNVGAMEGRLRRKAPQATVCAMPKLPASLKKDDRRRDLAEETLKRFNSDENDINVLLVSVEGHEEGISFLGVGRLILMNPADTWARRLQRVGRVTRTCDKQRRGNDDAEESNDKEAVSIDMYVTKVDGKETVDAYNLKQLDLQRQQFAKLRETWKTISTDGQLLQHKSGTIVSPTVARGLRARCPPAQNNSQCETWCRGAYTLSLIHI